MAYKQSDYYMPKTKAYILKWIKQHYWTIGQTVSGLDKLDKKKLMVIYINIMEGIK